MKEHLKKLSQKIADSKTKILTEEATKTAFILPFIASLGYDVFDPCEVIPEFTADMGIKQGEKVDYALVINGKPSVIIECKPCTNTLSITNESQLFRYFATTDSVRFGILTNGITYRFYTDLEKTNKMDTSHFLEINLEQFDRINFTELEKFKKENFNIETIVRTADVLKSLNASQKAILEEMENPSEEFVRVISKKISPGGLFTSTVKEKLTPLVKAAIEMIVNERVKEHLNNALNSTEDKTKEIDETVKTTQITENKNDINTTSEEIEGFHMIRAIGVSITDFSKIVLRDAKTYCAVLFEDNNRKPICRMHFNSSNKRLSFFDTETEEIVPITKIEDLYHYQDRILKVIAKYQTPIQESQK